MLSKLRDFILGKSSPLYKGDERTEFTKTKCFFAPVIRSISFISKYYETHISDKYMVLSPNDFSLIIMISFMIKL